MICLESDEREEFGERGGDEEERTCPINLACFQTVNYENEILSFFFNLINYLTPIIQIYSINHHRVFKSFVAFFSQPQEREVA